MNVTRKIGATKLITAIVRVNPHDTNVDKVIESLCEQIRQVIVVNDSQTNWESFQNTVKRKFIDKKVLFIDFSSPIGEQAFFVGAQLAKFEICLLWNTSLIMPDGLVEEMLEVYQENQLLGISGCALEDMTDYFLGLKNDWQNQTKVDYLESCGLMLQRRFLLLNGLPFNRQAMMVWVQANAKIKSHAKLSIFPSKIDVPIQKLDPTTLNAIKTTMALAYSKNDPSFENYKRWKEINNSILPKIKKGSHFQKLPTSKYKNLLLFGCQRTGTTWATNILGKYLPNTFAFSEKQTFYFLLDNYIIPEVYADLLIFKTTFINQEIESHENCLANTHFLLMVRNPFSVVYSLVHNFGMLAEVSVYYESRRKESDLVETDNKKLKMAVEIYRQSMRVSLDMLKKFDQSKMKVVFYDDMVLNTQEVLADIANFLDLDITDCQKTITNGNSLSLNKWHQLSQEELKFIRDYAQPIWKQFLEAAAKQSIHYAEIELSKLS